MRRVLIVFVFSAAFLTAVFVFRPAIGRFLVSFFSDGTSPSSDGRIPFVSSTSSPTHSIPTSTHTLIPAATSTPTSTSSLPKLPKPKPSVSDDKDKYEPCQTSFTLVSLYVYTPESLNQDHLDRLTRYHPTFEKVLNKAGRGKLTFSFYNPAVIPFPVLTEEEKRRFFFYAYNDPTKFAGLNARRIMQEVYKKYPSGSFDFVNIFSDMPEYKAASQHVDVQNRVKNADDSPYTGAYDYGDTKGRLLGVNFITDLQYLPSKIAFNETDEQIACDMGDTIAHETTHQWSAKAGSNEADPNALMPMRRYDGLSLLHWSYGLNIGYDPVGGARWQDNKDGTFTLIGPEEWCTPPPPEGSGFPPRLGFPRMSDLTLYLAGAIKKEEVKPMVWFDVFDPEVNPPTLFPFPSLSIGKTIVRSKTVKTITIEEIVKKYGKHECLKRGVRWP